MAPKRSSSIRRLEIRWKLREAAPLLRSSHGGAASGCQDSTKACETTDLAVMAMPRFYASGSCAPALWPEVPKEEGGLDHAGIHDERSWADQPDPRNRPPVAEGWRLEQHVVRK